MTKLNDLPPAALKAAMKSGTQSWGQWGSARDHEMYVQAISSRCRCRCGCKKRETHSAMANGLALSSGCELSTRRWVKEMNQKRKP